MTDSYSAGREKERYVEKLFASAAKRYDFLNSIMSLGRHRAWRRFAARQCRLEAGQRALDVAAGTGDLSLELLKEVGPGGTVCGVDFCMPMLQMGARKLVKAEGRAILAAANAEKLPFPDGAFDCAAIGFALRNVADVRAVISEMTRVVRPGGRVVSLEIFGPEAGWFLPFWKLYFGRIVPVAARMLGGGKEAYRYLPASVERFCSRRELKLVMEECGLCDVKIWNLALGAVCVHVGTRTTQSLRRKGQG